VSDGEVRSGGKFKKGSCIIGVESFNLFSFEEPSQAQKLAFAKVLKQNVVNWVIVVSKKD
jgi:hypothetical protein